MLLHCEHSGLCLIGIRHSFNNRKICARSLACSGNLRKGVHRLLKRQLPHWGKQLARRADIKGDEPWRITPHCSAAARALATAAETTSSAECPLPRSFKRFAPKVLAVTTWLPA